MKIALSPAVGEPVVILNSDSVNNAECDICGKEKPSIEMRAVDRFDNIYACPDCLIKALNPSGLTA